MLSNPYFESFNRIARKIGQQITTELMPIVRLSPHQPGPPTADHDCDRQQQRQ